MNYLLIVSAILIIGIVVINACNITESYDNIENQYLGNQEKYYESRLSGPTLPNQDNADKFYVYDASKSAGQQLVMKNPDVAQKTNDVDINVKRCKQITSCDELDGTNCGYCFLNDKFYYGNTDGPYTDVCPGGWVKTKEGCQERRERAICDKVTNCHEMTGEASICGWCAASNKAFVSKNVDGKLEPKYSTDTCADEGYGLVGPSDCTKFGQEHPCIGPNENTGPHSMTCLSALWKTSGCSPKGTTAPSQPGHNNSWWNERSWQAVLDDMKSWYSDATGSNWSLAQSHHEGCLGTPPNPCDSQYNPRPLECLQQQWIDAGCTKKGTGYPSTSNSSKYNSMSLSSVQASFKELLGNTQSSDFTTKSSATMDCFGNKLATPTLSMTNIPQFCTTEVLLGVGADNSIYYWTTTGWKIIPNYDTKAPKAITVYNNTLYCAGDKGRLFDWSNYEKKWNVAESSGWVMDITSYNGSIVGIGGNQPGGKGQLFTWTPSQAWKEIENFSASCCINGIATHNNVLYGISNDSKIYTWNNVKWTPINNFTESCCIKGIASYDGELIGIGKADGGMWSWSGTKWVKFNNYSKSSGMTSICTATPQQFEAFFGGVTVQTQQAIIVVSYGPTRAYNVEGSQVQDILTQVRTKYPEAQICTQSDMQNLVDTNTPYCYCGWHMNNGTLESGYPSVKGTSGGCGGGQMKVVSCGAWSGTGSNKKAGVYMKANVVPSSVGTTLQPLGLFGTTIKILS